MLYPKRRRRDEKMKAICVDVEPLAVEYTLDQCEHIPEIDEAKGFTDAQQALDELSAAAEADDAGLIPDEVLPAESIS